MRELLGIYVSGVAAPETVKKRQHIHNRNCSTLLRQISKRIILRNAWRNPTIAAYLFVRLKLKGVQDG